MLSARKRSFANDQEEKARSIHRSYEKEAQDAALSARRSILDMENRIDSYWEPEVQNKMDTPEDPIESYRALSVESLENRESELSFRKQELKKTEKKVYKKQEDLEILRNVK